MKGEGQMHFLQSNKSKIWQGIVVVLSAVSISVCAIDKSNENQYKLVGIAYTGANVINPSIESYTSNATILVRNGVIEKIQPDALTVPTGYSVIDLKNHWVIPGLIDGHVHLSQSGSAFTRPDTISAEQVISYEEDQRWLKEQLGELLNRYIKLGITTIFDLGGPSEDLAQYSATANATVSPNIYTAGTLMSPMDMPELDLDDKHYFTKVTTAEEAVELVKSQLKYNTDMIKLVWSQETGLTPETLLEMYKPAIKLAKSHNKVITIHVEELHNAKMAVKAGANILVHGVIYEPIDDELLQLMKVNNVTYMPTLTSYSHYFEFFKGVFQFTEFEKVNSLAFVTDSFSKVMSERANLGQMFQILTKFVPMVDMPKEKLKDLSPQEQGIIGQLKAVFSTKFEQVQAENLLKVVKAGVNVGLGTDAGNPGTLHALSLIGEMTAWQNAGITNQQIIKATTMGNALALNLENEIGSLVSGKNADFVVLSSNPFESLDTLMKPVMTVKNGQVVVKNGRLQNEL
jgi:imidazolonepropionase-like amidohydrolase